MNDYEYAVEFIEDALGTVETAYYKVVDPEDEAEMEEAMDILKRVLARTRAKA